MRVIQTHQSIVLVTICVCSGRVFKECSYLPHTFTRLLPSAAALIQLCDDKQSWCVTACGLCCKSVLHRDAVKPAQDKMTAASIIRRTTPITAVSMFVLPDALHVAAALTREGSVREQPELLRFLTHRTAHGQHVTLETFNCSEAIV